MPKTDDNTDIDAWYNSAFVAVSLGIICWVVQTILFGEIHDLIFVLLFSVPVHIGCYAILGFPIIRLFWTRPKALVWKLPVSPIVGTIAGFIVTAPFVDFNSKGEVTLLAIACVYGFITGLIAWVFRPKSG